MATGMQNMANGSFYAVDQALAEKDAEIARLRAEVEVGEKNLADAMGLLAESDAENAWLEAEVEGLQRTEARYRWLQKQTPYRFGKIQAACVIDAVDTLYFKADEFDGQVDAAMGASA